MCQISYLSETHILTFEWSCRMINHRKWPGRKKKWNLSISAEGFYTFFAELLNSSVIWFSHVINTLGVDIISSFFSFYVTLTSYTSFMISPCFFLFIFLLHPDYFMFFLCRGNVCTRKKKAINVLKLTIKSQPSSFIVLLCYFFSFFRHFDFFLSTT